MSSAASPIRASIATRLLRESDMKLVGEATNGREAIAKFRECRPDVTVMDLQMLEMSSCDAIIAIHNGFAGAQAYLLKSSLYKELLHAIRAAPARVADAKSHFRRRFGPFRKKSGVS